MFGLKRFIQHKNAYFAVFIGGLTLGLLAGCSSDSNVVAQGIDYRARIANILDDDDLRNMELQHLTEKKAITFPSSRELTLPLEKVEISWSTFLSLAECSDLQIVIGNRNNQLGAQMEAATRLLYEVTLLASLNACVAKLDDVNADLAFALETKTQQQSTIVWNHTWASHYWQTLMSNARRSESYQKSDHSAVVDSLTFIRGVTSLNQQAHIDIKSLQKDSILNELTQQQWYSAYRTVEESKGILSNLFYEVHLSIGLLKAIDDALERNKKKICPQQKKTQKLEYLNNVLDKYYVKLLQGMQGELVSAARIWEAEVVLWQQSSQHFSSLTTWSDFYFDVNDPWSEQLIQAVRQHVKQWQQLASYCNTSLVFSAQP